MPSFPTTNTPLFTWGVTSKKYTAVGIFDDAEVIGPAVVFAKISPDGTGLVALTNPLTGAASPCRGIFADVAGTLTGCDAFGNVVTNFPLQAGYNPISLAEVNSIATTTQVWGVW